MEATCTTVSCGALCRELPAGLATAPQLTKLVLRSPSHEWLGVSAGSLPAGLLHVRLAECSDSEDFNDWGANPLSHMTLQRPHNFGDLRHLRQLQLTARGVGPLNLPTG